MYRRPTNTRYQVSESSEYDEQNPEQNFYKFYEKKRIKPGSSSSETASIQIKARNSFLERKKIGNAYSERNVKKPSSCRAKRKLKELELKAKKTNTVFFDCKDEKKLENPQNGDFLISSNDVSTYIENILEREAFDFNYEELNFLEERLVDETLKAQNLKKAQNQIIKFQSSDKDIIRKFFPITNNVSEISVFQDDDEKEMEKAHNQNFKIESSDEQIIRKVFPITNNVKENIEEFVRNDFLDLFWSRFNGMSF